jgi:hypothetical protein
VLLIPVFCLCAWRETPTLACLAARWKSVMRADRKNLIYDLPGIFDNPQTLPPASNGAPDHATPLNLYGNHNSWCRSKPDSPPECGIVPYPGAGDPGCSSDPGSLYADPRRRV